MSDTETKEKHSKRLYKEKVKIKKQLEIAKTAWIINPDETRKIQEPHRLSKMHAFNCGDPNCHMCGNPRKFFKEDTIQEKSFKQRKLYEED